MVSTIGRYQVSTYQNLSKLEEFDEVLTETKMHSFLRHSVSVYVNITVKLIFYCIVTDCVYVNTLIQTIVQIADHCVYCIICVKIMQLHLQYDF